jgi:hypothetical protein
MVAEVQLPRDHAGEYCISQSAFFSYYSEINHTRQDYTYSLEILMYSKHLKKKNNAGREYTNKQKNLSIN